MEPGERPATVEQVDAAPLDERAAAYLGVLEDLQRRLGLPGA